MISTEKVCLNKEVCLKCHLKRWSSINDVEKEKWFDDLWKSHIVFCMSTGDFSVFISINELPPKDCPYLLEHVVNKNE